MYQTDYDFFSPRGWICPKCGRVYSPSTSMCYYCSGNASPPTITSTGTGILNDKGWWESYLKQITADNVGGSDYWDNVSQTWANIINSFTNKKDEGDKNERF